MGQREKRPSSVRSIEPDTPKSNKSNNSGKEYAGGNVRDILANFIKDVNHNKDVRDDYILNSYKTPPK